MNDIEKKILKIADGLIEPEQTDFVTQEVEEALNYQVANELHAAYKYLAMGAWFSNKGLDGFGIWFKRQAFEEIRHAEKVFDFLIKSGSTTSLLPDVPSPAFQAEKAIEVVGMALEHEKLITKQWYEIMELVSTSGNYAAKRLCQDFLNEQMEEEDLFVSLFQKTNLADEEEGLLVLDMALAKDVEEN